MEINKKTTECRFLYIINQKYQYQIKSINRKLVIIYKYIKKTKKRHQNSV